MAQLIPPPTMDRYVGPTQKQTVQCPQCHERFEVQMLITGMSVSTRTGSKPDEHDVLIELDVYAKNTHTHANPKEKS